jgi:replication initiation protein RepC
MQQQDMGLGVSQVKSLNRHLVELGLVMMRDSPNGKRYGRRGPQGRIIEAYGFDLSPIAGRFAEFQEIAQAGRAERARIAALKRRATIGRNGIRQLLETANEHGIAGDEWDAWQRSAALASRGLAGRRNPVEMEMAVATLERVQSEMRLSLETAFASRADSQTKSASSSVDTNPTGPENRPHITSTTQILNPKDTVIAPDGGWFPASRNERPDRQFEKGPPNVARGSVENFKRPATDARTDSGSLLKITPGELMKLAPRLGP